MKGIRLWQKFREPAQKLKLGVDCLVNIPVPRWTFTSMATEKKSSWLSFDFSKSPIARNQLKFVILSCGIYFARELIILYSSSSHQAPVYNT